MEELLAHPAIQAGVLPLIVASVSALILRRFGTIWAGFGFLFAFYSTVYLIVGFDLTPLTSTRKLIILGFIAFLVGLSLDLKTIQKSILPFVLAILVACGILWIIWPVLIRKQGSELWVLAISSSLYTAWLTASFHKLQAQTTKTTVSIFALAMGTGISVMLGASALLGQLGITIGAAAGVFILLSFFFSHFKLAYNYVIPSVSLSAYIGIAGVIYASLPWYSLLPLMFIPLAAQIPNLENRAKYKQILLICAVTLPLSATAIIITWQQAGEMAY